MSVSMPAGVDVPKAPPAEVAARLLDGARRGRGGHLPRRQRAGHVDRLAQRPQGRRARARPQRTGLIGLMDAALGDP